MRMRRHQLLDRAKACRVQRGFLARVGLHGHHGGSRRMSGRKSRTIAEGANSVLYSLGTRASLWKKASLRL